MPWIEGRTNPEPGGYYDQDRNGGPVRLLQVLPNGYVLMPDGLRAPVGAAFMSHRQSLRIPSPAVLLAMEEFVAAYRAWDVAEGKPVEERYAEERAFQRLVDRRDATWSALARAEAEAKGGKP